ncbi:dethiobiotin synthase [Desulfogranum mediterraneum]|uniref:dethiobiotin synthase n=1 Tax=Desulfogranum mediterraneum TaxID=160661 RepID=UPI000410ED72|nr:dethiobiotin synthase [Desulfogranum mediterraneum]
MESKHKSISIVGIDTDVGKSVVTGLLAAYLVAENSKVTTLKLVQTGCSETSDDILLHRKLMGSPLSRYDEERITCPYLFPFPASPRLAARMAGTTIDPQVFDQAITTLQGAYEWLLVEGAGGLLVPLNENLLLIDYLAAQGLPVVLVTSSKLGSINHTRLSLEALKSRKMKLLGLVYNLHNPGPPEIVQDSLAECRQALKDYDLDAPLVVMPDTNESQAVNWRPLLAPLTAE